MTSTRQIDKENNPIFREKAPELSHRDMFLDDHGNVIPGKSRYTSWASGVPGTVYGLGYAHEKYGILPWDVLIYPSINHEYYYTLIMIIFDDYY